MLPYTSCTKCACFACLYCVVSVWSHCVQLLCHDIALSLRTQIKYGYVQITPRMHTCVLTVTCNYASMYCVCGVCRDVQHVSGRILLHVRRHLVHNSRYRMVITCAVRCARSQMWYKLGPELLHRVGTPLSLQRDQCFQIVPFQSGHETRRFTFNDCFLTHVTT